MPSPARLFVLLVVVFSLFSVMNAGAQPPANGVTVDTDLELLSLSNLDGGGRIIWRYTGANATLLRTKMLQMYDQEQYIPYGFLLAGRGTGTVPPPSPSPTFNNGVLDEGEAEEYLVQLELELEDNIPSGERLGARQFRSVVLRGTDLAQRDLPPQESSEGLVGSTAGSAQNLEIRFIFDIREGASARDFAQADTMLASAPHRVFRFRIADNLVQTSLCPPSCTPFPTRGGWRVIAPSAALSAGGPFLWHGNPGATPWDENATNVYDPAAANATNYTTDVTGGAPVTVDLRFATTATFSFDHTGGTGAEAGQDVLRVQLSEDGVSWQNLTATNDGDGNAPIDDWPVANLPLATSEFDLGPWVGQRVWLRLNFEADGDAAVDGPGFYVRNLRIDGPSYLNSTIEFRHVDYLVGFGSLVPLASPGAKPTIVRTPVGEVMWYSATYRPTGDGLDNDLDTRIDEEAWDGRDNDGDLRIDEDRNGPPTDQARYSAFDVIENPQILFVLLVVVAWVMGLLHDKTWERYRMKHPQALRPTAVRIKWLQWVARIVLLLLVVFYFFPTLLGADLMIGGVAFWALSITSLVAVSGFTWFWYDRQAKIALAMPPALPEAEVEEEPPPPPPSPEELPRAICAHCALDIEDPATLFRCVCGQTYHAEHAVEVGTCVNCGRPLRAAPPEKQLLTVKCPSCGEINLLAEGADARVAKCTACSSILQEISKGYNYLVIADEPHVAYEWFKGVVKGGVPGLCMSTTFPEKLRREYGLPDVELYWMSDTNPGPRTLDPKRLDFEIMRAMSNFLKANKGGALVLDGLEYLVVENSFDRVLRFIKKVNDLASVHDATMFVPITPTGLGPEEATLLRKEFDKVETIGAAK